MSKIVNTRDTQRVELGYNYAKINGDYHITVEIPIQPQEDKDKRFCAVVSELVEAREDIKQIRKCISELYEFNRTKDSKQKNEPKLDLNSVTKKQKSNNDGLLAAGFAGVLLTLVTLKILGLI